jgi:hypothetical protein
MLLIIRDKLLKAAMVWNVVELLIQVVTGCGNIRKVTPKNYHADSSSII